MPLSRVCQSTAPRVEDFVSQWFKCVFSNPSCISGLVKDLLVQQVKLSSDWQLRSQKCEIILEKSKFLCAYCYYYHWFDSDIATTVKHMSGGNWSQVTGAGLHGTSVFSPFVFSKGKTNGYSISFHISRFFSSKLDTLTGWWETELQSLNWDQAWGKM